MTTPLDVDGDGVRNVPSRVPVARRVRGWAAA